MNFSSEDIKNVLSKNFGYKKSSEEYEPLVVDARTAYRFCLATESFYLNNENGLGVFNRLTTFNHRNNSLNTGLFGFSREKRSNYNLIQEWFNKYPFIFKGEKKIVFLDYTPSTTNRHCEEIYNILKNNNKNPENYILNLVHPKGSQHEHYFEFMASEYFSDKGYLTDIQLPWNYRGRPDFGIYKHPIIGLLQEKGLIKNGAMILELNSLSRFEKKQEIGKKSFTNKGYEFIVGEVKTTQQKSQIEKYLKLGICHKGYEFIQNKKKPELFSGLINIDEAGKLQVVDAPVSEYYNVKEAGEDKIWFEKYIKTHLLANLSEERLKKLININNINKLSVNKFLICLDKLSFDEILEGV